MLLGHIRTTGLTDEVVTDASGPHSDDRADI
jgi:hypothetical protein